MSAIGQQGVGDLYLLESWDTLAQLDRFIRDEQPRDVGEVDVLLHRLEGSSRQQGEARIAELVEEVGPRLACGDAAVARDAMRSVVSVFIERTVDSADPASVAEEDSLSLEPFTAEVLHTDEHEQTPPGLLQEQPAARGRNQRPEGGSPKTASPEAASPGPGLEEPGGVDTQLRRFLAGDEALVEGFRSEVNELLDSVYAELRDPAGRADSRARSDSVASLFRQFHTIKGSSLVVGCEPIGRLAHLVEDHLDRVRAGQCGLDRPLVLEAHRLTGVMLWFDRSPMQGVEEALASIERYAAAADGRSLEPSQLVPIDVENDGHAAEPKPRLEIRTVRTDVARVDRIINGLSQISSERSDFEHVISSLADLRAQVDASQSRVARLSRSFESSFVANHDGPEVRSTAASDFGVGEFDEWNDVGLLARQMEEISSDLKTLGASLADDLTTLRSKHAKLQRVSSDLRVEIGRLRMIPMTRVFERLRRSFDSALSPSLGVDFEVSGESTEVDSAVFGEMFEALEHVLVNALVHAFETPSERELAGKQRRGRLQVLATQGRDTVGLEIRDDGRGVDVEALAARALQLGLVSAGQLASMPDDRRWELMLLPGVSTRHDVDIRSGRGVGMDIVADRVRRVGGELRVETTPGSGTRFLFELPLTLVVADALLVEAGGQRFAFPSRKVLKVLQERAPSGAPEARELATDVGNVPVFSLEGLLGIPLQAVSGGHGATVLLKTARGPLALEVDRVDRIEEVVLRSPGRFLEPLEYLLGGVMGSRGEGILMLNPEALWTFRERVQVAAVRARPAAARLLLVDDSPSVRRVVAEKLSDLGLEVSVARDGLEAREAIARRNFELVLTDLEMPNMHGYDLIRSLRKDGVETPIVVMTTRVSSKHRQAAKQLGVQRVLTKPASHGDLLDVVSLAQEVRQ